MRLVSTALLLAFATGAAFAKPGGGGPPSMPPGLMRASLPEKARSALPDMPGRAKGKGPEAQRLARELRRAARRDAAEGYPAAAVLATYERDGIGQWFRRGEIVVVGVSQAVAATAAMVMKIRRFWRMTGLWSCRYDETGNRALIGSFWPNISGAFPGFNDKIISMYAPGMNTR